VVFPSSQDNDANTVPIFSHIFFGPDERRTVSKRLFDCVFCAHVVIVRSAYASVRV